MSFYFPKLLLPRTGLLVEGAIVKPTGGRWSNLLGSFELGNELQVFSSLEASKNSTGLSFSAAELLAMGGDEDLDAAARARCKKAFLAQIYFEYLSKSVFQEATEA